MPLSLAKINETPVIPVTAGVLLVVDRMQSCSTWGT